MSPLAETACSSPGWRPLCAAVDGEKKGRGEALAQQNFNVVSTSVFKLKGSSNNLVFYGQSAEPSFPKHSLTKKASLSPMGK